MDEVERRDTVDSTRSFDEAEASFRAYNQAVLYVTSPDNKARFALGELGARNLVVFGVNPSTATDQVFDQTIRRIEGYSRAHGFGGWLMLNLYPQRATDPANLHTERDATLHTENIAAITRCLQDVPDFTLCAAWGTVIERRAYLPPCLVDIAATLASHKWHSIGAPTKSGHPSHPLYVRRSTPLQPFDIAAYVETNRMPVPLRISE